MHHVLWIRERGRGGWGWYLWREPAAGQIVEEGEKGRQPERVDRRWRREGAGGGDDSPSARAGWGAAGELATARAGVESSVMRDRRWWGRNQRSASVGRGGQGNPSRRGQCRRRRREEDGAATLTAAPLRGVLHAPSASSVGANPNLCGNCRLGLDKACWAFF